MANATIDALYAGSLRLKISYFFFNNFSFYKWCVTKVAHCTADTMICYPNSILNLNFSCVIDFQNQSYMATECIN